MPTRVSKISRSLILELPGSAITAEVFRKAVDAFVDLINEVTKGMSGSSDDVKWVISVSRGSAKIHFQAEPVNIPLQKLPALTNVIQTGIRSIQSESKRPPHFSDIALRKAKDLVSVIEPENGGPKVIRIWHKREACSLTSEALVNVNLALSEGSKDWGSIEGRLSMISERTGHKFTVYDRLLDKHILCNFPPRLLSKVLDAFGKRVSVYGLIRYSAGGEIEKRTC